MTTIDATLIEQRRTITDELASCDRGAYPGSREYFRESAALKALGEFDKAHPEVIEHIKAERSARIQSEHPYQD